MNGLDAVIHEIDLSFARQLQLDCGASDIGLYFTTEVWMESRFLGGV